MDAPKTPPLIETPHELDLDGVHDPDQDPTHDLTGDETAGGAA